MTADAATTGGLVVLGRDEVAAALVDHAYTYPDSFCECGAWIDGHTMWRGHVADVVTARGRPVAEVVAGFAEDEALVGSVADTLKRCAESWGEPHGTEEARYRARRSLRRLATAVTDSAAALVEQEAER